MDNKFIENIVFDNIVVCLEAAERRIYKNDHDLILRITSENRKHHAAEPSIVFHFGSYLFNQLQKNDCLRHFHLDCEYNLDIEGYKNREGRFLYPDLIIHTRKSNEHNLVIIECKGWWSNEVEIQEAKDKIRFFISPYSNYSYRYGLLMKFEENEINYEWIND